jgi:hypothetical protein
MHSASPTTGAVVGEVVEDLVGGLDPDEGFRVGVPRIDRGGDVGFEGFDAAVAAAAQLAAGEFGEPSEVGRPWCNRLRPLIGKECC